MAPVEGARVVLPFGTFVAETTPGNGTIKIPVRRVGPDEEKYVELDVDLAMLGFVNFYQGAVDPAQPIALIPGTPGSPENPITINTDPTHPIGGIPSRPLAMQPPLEEPEPEVPPVREGEEAVDVPPAYKTHPAWAALPVPPSANEDEGKDKPDQALPGKPVKPGDGDKPDHELPGKPDDDDKPRPTPPIAVPPPARPGGGPTPPPARPTPRR